MAIRYEKADDIKKIAEGVVGILGWKHVDLENVGFIRSRGSTARRTIARCHGLGKAMQLGMGRETSFYLIEVISEQFDKMSEEERVKVIIHELMHIPKTFGGGFIHHDKVNERRVKIFYDLYYELRRNENV